MSKADTVVRHESDAEGVVDIPAHRYWGAQTQRALELFTVGNEKLPSRIVHTFGWHKAAAAYANQQLGCLPHSMAKIVEEASLEVASGLLDDHFPLPLWQTGSGTQTNMNANEVIANRANELQGFPLGSKHPVHPNDHVNRSQSSNDSFPTVMNVAATLAVREDLLPELKRLEAVFTTKAAEFSQAMRIGRTHLNDAVPMLVGQSFDVYRRQIELGIGRIKETLVRLEEVPQGGTAIGTGANAPKGFDTFFCERMSALLSIPIHPAQVKGEAMSAHDALVELSGSLNGLAVTLTKIANDIRLLSAGPRSGIGEYLIPDDGLSSSIMPGKRNATVAEVLIQVCQRVMGSHVTVTHAGASGLFELNVAKPVLIHAVLESIELLTDACGVFRERLLIGLAVDRERLEKNVSMSLMLATGLSPLIGYDKVAEISRKAQKEGTSVRDAALALAYVSPQDFDSYTAPSSMLGPFASVTVPIRSVDEN
ncbi:class II fumarate hydratase [Billgrantia endophytica]|uniref:fumarate hydratase n=1 Tax=Billgrantia endophytica TaxID=2033802 RepID=A0A2N7U0S4_9GAMM|nr:class II fumarate hydratase [Halomonas endophytica]PMR74030.1 class II fumarate hydratase [Halomonas endophytica]